MTEPRQIKQVIVMRKDLNMRKGKMIAQGAHASSMFLVASSQIHENQIEVKLTDVESAWLLDKFTKITVGVGSAEELLEVFKAANEAGLKVYACTDIGLTEFHGVPTTTCIAIGPDYSDKIDLITGHLKLL